MTRNKLLKEMTWDEFMSWGTYEAMYPTGWRDAQNFGLLMSQNASNDKRKVKPSDIYPFLDNIGTQARDRVREADEATENGMAIISPSVLIMAGQYGGDEDGHSTSRSSQHEGA